ncbi:MAG TPA: sigma-70 family RNA polymerase sigma factor [Polyangiaceae bacterium]|nr:sigma-70 family RNA polymerase sigma factor [Polyangiaceae bacterium]
MSAPSDPPEIRERFDAALDLVESIVRQVARAIGAGVELDELRSFGHEGLLDAARRFDAERGVPFRGYASFRVRGAIIDGVRSLARLPRRTHQRLNGLAAASRTSEGALEDTLAAPPPGATPADAELALRQHLAAMATAAAVGLIAPTAQGEDGDVTALETGDDPESAVARAELVVLLRGAIDELPEQEAQLVRRHYLAGERFDQVAADLGLSKSWASRLHTRAIQRLTKRLRPAVG